MGQAKTMSKSAIEKLLKDLKADGLKFNDEEAYDMALSILDDEEGLREGIKVHYKVSDQDGWLADRI